MKIDGNSGFEVRRVFGLLFVSRQELLNSARRVVARFPHKSAQARSVRGSIFLRHADRIDCARRSIGDRMGKKMKKFEKIKNKKKLIQTKVLFRTGRPRSSARWHEPRDRF